MQDEPKNILSMRRQLFDAIDSGDSVRIRDLISAGADVNFRGDGPDAETPLIRAVTAKQLSAVRALIEAGAGVNSAGRLSGWAPLMFALDNPEIMRALICAGADVNARTPVFEADSPVSGKRLRRGGETAIHFAAAANNAEAVRILAQAGANVEARDESGCAPLDVALRLGSPTDAAVALVEAGAELTPERLEAMHSGAHEPHSTLCFFPSPGELALNQGKGAMFEAASRPKPPAIDAAEKDAVKCATCGALIYSRKARLCGNCGALLAPELRLNESQSQIIESERQWARKVADKFDTKRPSGDASRKPSVPTEVTISSPADLIRGVSFAEQFRHRRRPDFWIQLIGYAFVLLAFIWVLEMSAGELPITVSLVAISFCAVACYTAWQRAAPVCPNCRKDIRRCARLFCIACGKPARAGRCNECGTSDSVESILPTFGRGENPHLISHCPNCGVWLDSRIPR